MTPSRAVLVTTTQVLLCPFVTDVRAAPAKAINPEACDELRKALPDGQIPVGCVWDRADPLSVPRCRVSTDLLCVCGKLSVSPTDALPVCARHAHL